MPITEISKATPADVLQTDITAWIDFNEIKNEKGDLIDLTKEHYFLADIFRDSSQFLVVLKAAQIGLSTLEILKNFYDAFKQKMDIIYTLPTDSDVNLFVGGKVNRLIAQNPPLQSMVKDGDSIEKKRVGSSIIYFRGTWTAKSAIMITADRLVHDEKDSSKQSVVKDYEARLQHSKLKQKHVFSHPSVPNQGVDVEWQMSDQKEWFIVCPHCSFEHYLAWNTEDPRKMSVDLGAREFICKKCHGTLRKSDRAVGRWLPRKGRENQPYSGYHISLLMAPWITAGEIVDKWNDVMEARQTIDWFYNKVLGLPFAGSGNAVSEDAIMGAWTRDKNLYKGRMIVGVDTGVALRYVVGNEQGFVGFGEMKGYVPNAQLGITLEQSLEYWLKKFPDCVMVIDQGGDIIGSRQLQKLYPGRVFLCFYVRDRKTQQLIRWGENDESGRVLVDRNNMIQLLIDEFREKRLHLYGGATKNEWWDYWLHWSHIHRVMEEDKATQKKLYTWVRSDRDDYVHASVYCRVGIDRFGKKGEILGADLTPEPNSYMMNPDGISVSFDPDAMFRKPEKAVNPYDDRDDGDWRDR
jgi:hypothetical protein